MDDVPKRLDSLSRVQSRVDELDRDKFSKIGYAQGRHDLIVSVAKTVGVIVGLIAIVGWMGRDVSAQATASSEPVIHDRRMK